MQTANQKNWSSSCSTSAAVAVLQQRSTGINKCKMEKLRELGSNNCGRGYRCPAMEIGSYVLKFPAVIRVVVARK
ncbi:hypothetical protein F0562_012035 [Nyssa sinensis]|uniref:Uncharacterized protein n=1 Tax=Nyssa sinensis TaxID=561372 RepID=A0A5J4ZRE5_9ASTE|nr:hypothetical protein F0562_012035 [Nyssa sinensis]